MNSFGVNVEGPQRPEHRANDFEQRTTANGIFGSKLLSGYFDKIVRKLKGLRAYKDNALSTHDLLQTAYPNLRVPPYLPRL
jgi:hypothetical protein